MRCRLYQSNHASTASLAWRMVSKRSPCRRSTFNDPNSVHVRPYRPARHLAAEQIDYYRQKQRAFLGGHVRDVITPDLAGARRDGSCGSTDAGCRLDSKQVSSNLVPVHVPDLVLTSSPTFDMSSAVYLRSSS